jgi:hypothetical protein
MQASRADAIASLLGMQRVGMIFNQSTCEKEYIMNDEEVYQMCSLSAEIGEHCVIAVFSMLEEEGQVRRPSHHNAYSCSPPALPRTKLSCIMLPTNEAPSCSPQEVETCAQPHSHVYAIIGSALPEFPHAYRKKFI